MSNYGRLCIHVSCGVAKNYFECYIIIVPVIHLLKVVVWSVQSTMIFDIFICMPTIETILLFCIYVVHFKLLATPTGSYDVLTKELKRHDIEYFLQVMPCILIFDCYSGFWWFVCSPISPIFFAIYCCHILL